MILLPRLVASLFFGLIGCAAHAALGDTSLLGSGTKDDVILVQAGTAAPLYVSAADWPGVQRAAHDLQADFARVTGVKPACSTAAPGAGPVALLVGTIGRSPLIDGLIASGKLSVTEVNGKWESFVIATVDQPLPGVGRALVVAGSDKRGTIYGIYEVSQQIGVSPWYWWADVPVAHRDLVAFKPGRRVAGEPSVRYRGIFLNDEAPDLTNWVRAKYGPAPLGENPPIPAGVANYGHEFYGHLFELMLRLRANYLWPAM